MSELSMKILVLGMVQTNCYIISNEETKEAIVFDPADQAERIEQYLKANDLVCKGILLTHGHFDHILAASELATATKAPIHCHEAEVELLSDPRMNASSQIHRECRLVPEVRLADDQSLSLAGFAIRVIDTPGHTAGGVCYYFTKHRILISGDTLFRDSVGRTDLPTGDSEELIKSIRTKLMVLEDEVLVYPGHGDKTTIGYERENNIYLSGSWYFDE